MEFGARLSLVDMPTVSVGVCWSMFIIIDVFLYVVNITFRSVLFVKICILRFHVW